MRIIDLSVPIQPSPPGVPEFQRVSITYSGNAQGGAEIEQMFGVPRELLRNGEGWATETFTNFGTHSSTHVDAPLHYNSTIGGEPAQSIDQLPLEWFFAPGVALDFRHKADGEVVTVEDLIAELSRIGHTLKERDIVLIRTGRDEFYGQPDYWLRGPGVSADATRWLFAQGVRVMGIDAWGWDAPLDRQAAAAREGNAPGVFWAAHQVDLPYSQIERLANLGALPPSGFQVACFPLRLVGGSAAPARVVAILN
ncbi:cyclase family protein [Deinococcus aerius]|uniref:Cyclase family protein n=1 Tax=Deinococcus aerius TaxID=200253 RepID=A0A2I9D0F2_9DEIO|nr:cyclase family protein [Deinococcus aerius]GBF07992.1 cyclase family protein [Deinococcus aerius]